MLVGAEALGRQAWGLALGWRAGGKQLPSTPDVEGALAVCTWCDPALGVTGACPCE